MSVDRAWEDDDADLSDKISKITIVRLIAVARTRVAAWPCLFLGAGCGVTCCFRMRRFGELLQAAASIVPPSLDMSARRIIIARPIGLSPAPAPQAPETASASSTPSAPSGHAPSAGVFCIPRGCITVLCIETSWFCCAVRRTGSWMSWGTGDPAGASVASLDTALQGALAKQSDRIAVLKYEEMIVEFLSAPR